MNQDLIDQDLQQRKLALDASKSFIVQAPAGSGKTELLIQRFLTLLNQVKKPEEILAITFTKKAANEMRLRVIKALKFALNEPEPESAHGKQTWHLAKQVLQRDEQFQWHLISNPNQLRIQTIDALCTYLTRQLPLLSHFGSQPDIADSATILYNDTVQEVLSHVEENFEWSQAISSLLLHLDNDLNKLHDLLVTLLAKRDQWIPYIGFDNNPDVIRKQLENQLGAVVSDSLKVIAEHFPDEIADELMACARFAADNLIYAGKESAITICRDIQRLPGIKADDRIIWQGLAKLLLTEEGTWRKAYTVNNGFPPEKSAKNPEEKALYSMRKQTITELVASLQDFDDFRHALHEITFLPDHRYQDAQWKILQSLLLVLKIIAAQLRVTFRQHGKIDFIENSQAALSALGSDEAPTDLALALDYQIRHILIDEFQDTSLSQYRLLKMLTTGWETNDGRTLFVVGDPMQSIYRFREADVGLFIRMRKSGIGNIKLTPLTLALNFRSTAKVVEWNNTQFDSIFPSFNDIATGAVTFSHSISNKNNDTPDNLSNITINGYEDADEQTTGNKIAELIKQTSLEYPNESIALLIRSRTHLSAIIPALKRHQIPYRAIDIDPLASRQCIQDLLSLTCAMLHPADRISWLAVLRAPWCGLTLADLLVIAGNNAYTAIMEELAKPEILQQLSADGKKRIERILPILTVKMAERERSSLRYWIESTWLLLGGPACLTDISDINDTKAFFTLLDEFSQNSRILNLDALKEKINRLYASSQHDHATVQIMTVHTAKGLEFDTVIMPHLERKPSSDDTSLLLWMEQPLESGQPALLLAPVNATGTNKDPIYEYINRRQRIKAKYEIERLFYVAATRAKKRLHLFFNVKSREKEGYKIEPGSFLEKLWPMIKNQQDTIVSKPAPQPETATIENVSNRHILRLQTAWLNPINEPEVAKAAYHQQKSGFDLGSDLFRLSGIVTHMVLQKISQFGTTWWTGIDENTKKSYLESRFLQAGLPPEDKESAINKAYSAVNNMLADKRGQWILHSHKDAKSEYALTAVINNKIENLVIDRTFIDDNGTRWIIDYKTTAFTQDDMHEFLANEQKKYQEKMHKYSIAMRKTDERAVKCGLYFPALSAWHEWAEEI